MITEKFPLQLSYLFQNKHEYALSKDTDVTLWLAYRAYTHACINQT